MGRASYEPSEHCLRGVSHPVAEALSLGKQSPGGGSGFRTSEHQSHPVAKGSTASFLNYILGLDEVIFFLKR